MSAGESKETPEPKGLKEPMLGANSDPSEWEWEYELIGDDGPLSASQPMTSAKQSRVTGACRIGTGSSGFE